MELVSEKRAEGRAHTLRISFRIGRMTKEGAVPYNLYYHVQSVTHPTTNKWRVHITIRLIFF